MSSPQKDNILLFGATGYIGAYILQQLVAAKHNFGRIAIFTSRETAQKKPSLLQAYKLDGVETIIGDVRNAEDIVNAFQGW